MKTESPLANATVMPQQVAPVAPNVPVAAELPPPFPQLQSGEIPAVLVPPITETLMQNPVINTLISVFSQLPDMGLKTFETQALSTVIYNPQSIDEVTLKEAEVNGTLEQIAVPMPGGDEVPAETAAPAGGPLASAQVSAPSNVNQSRLTSARTQNISPRQVSPVQPNPVTSQLARRAM